MYALHVLDTRQLADFIREGQSQNESLSGLFSDCRFCDFPLLFRCFFAGFLLLSLLQLLFLSWLREPACLLARLFGLLLLLSLFSKGAAFGYSWCAADANESTGLLFYTPPCVSTSVPFDCESSANRAYIPVKLILHGHKRFVARF